MASSPLTAVTTAQLNMSFQRDIQTTATKIQTKESCLLTKKISGDHMYTAATLNGFKNSPWKTVHAAVAKFLCKTTCENNGHPSVVPYPFKAS